MPIFTCVATLEHTSQPDLENISQQSVPVVLDSALFDDSDFSD